MKEKVSTIRSKRKNLLNSIIFNEGKEGCVLGLKISSASISTSYSKPFKLKKSCSKASEAVILFVSWQTNLKMMSFAKNFL